VPITPLEIDPAQQRLAQRRLRIVNLLGWFAAGMFGLALTISLLS
jgi:hypothetical protein